ncbi:hypothetical protein GMORB2_0189 [Geosmithia morbida]|uniref:Uncharacterized protein n=1 Tax=Geosmithia morbida TaxID=1094350 RepID=A0A9P5D3Q1_9HYPO|nr:uncharacterized protein GMORB2_0189 [Geosmithia morbida]KAF4126453.1 hypothetical protein GMORB2_0189 [Geosmithia morbida]
MSKEKKWGPSEQLDLALAVLFSQGGDKPKYDWAKIHEYMTDWGHTFTREATSQHWSKAILRDFKKRRGDSTPGTPALPASPVKYLGSAKKVSKRGTDAFAAEGDDDDPAAELARPTKKRRGKSATIPVKEYEEDYDSLAQAEALKVDVTPKVEED